MVYINLVGLDIWGFKLQLQLVNRKGHENCT